MLVVSFSWITFVELTPASARPFVGSSTNNTELGLTFEYNGLGRVGGQAGGPGEIPSGTGGLVRAAPGGAAHGHRPPPPARSRALSVAKPPRPSAAHRPPAFLPNGRERNPIPFGGTRGPLRLFGVGLGDQGGWILPFAFFGLLGVGLVILLGTDISSTLTLRSPVAPRRYDPRLAGLIVLGGWFLIEAAVLSLSRGIVHPYYVSALAPPTAAMAGAGAAAFVALASRERRDWRLLLAPLAILTTVAVQIVLLHREHYMHWFIPVLLIGAAVGIGALMLPRLARSAMAVTFCLLLVAPTAYATTTWLGPGRGHLPGRRRKTRRRRGRRRRRRSRSATRSRAGALRRDPPARHSLGGAHRRRGHRLPFHAPRPERGLTGGLQWHGSRS